MIRLHTHSRRTSASPRCLAAGLLAVSVLLLSACGKDETPANKPQTPASPASPAADAKPAAAPADKAVTPASTPAPSSATTPAPVPGAPPTAPAAPAGWYAVYSGPGTSGNTEVRTHSAYAAFAIKPDQTIEPSLSTSGWTAAYSGIMEIEEPGQYRFMVETEGGQATLSAMDMNSNDLGKGKPTAPGKLQTDYFKLPAGKVQLTIRFTNNGSSPQGARLRTYWEMERSSMGTGFHPEPIPTAVVSAPKFGAQFAATGYAAMRGRVLLGESGCLHCHAPGEASQGKLATAVATRQAPRLAEIGRRASPEWLKKWILNPHDIRPASGMPDVIGDSPKDLADAEAIVHFLVAPLYDSDQWSQTVATEKEVLAQGRELFHTVGCIQCHAPIESPLAVFGETGQPAQVPQMKAPLPYGKIADKWQPAELAAFLKDPLKTRPAGRMPSMNLTDEEADLLATYLISAWNPEGRPAAPAFAIDPAKVETGKAAFAARGCADCHEMGENLPNIATTLKSPALASLIGAAASRGCLDPAHTTSPRYQLDDNQRQGLKWAIEAALRATGTPAPIDAELRMSSALSCRECHTKDGRGGPPSPTRPYFRTLIEIDLGDEGRLPPHLNLAGWKLTTPWIREVMIDAGRARPYMAVRMPQFGKDNADVFVEGLAQLAGVWPDSDLPDPVTSDDIVVAGRQLVGDGGLNCISCHAFAELPPAGPPGPNISHFASRLRYDWWHTYALGPARQKPGTRMPAFFATGKSTKTDILAGDPDKQIDAMWSYFNLSSFAPPPSGIQTGKGLALSVGDRPRIFRSFMKDAGSRGIAVGFPVGTHFGFDATGVRLVDAWKGDFIDASGAWTNRGGTVASGQGKAFWKAPAGPPLVLGQTAPASWPAKAGDDVVYKFDGYRLDAAGIPTFLYRIGAVSVEETFTPADGGVRRAFRLTGVPAGAKVFFNAGPGTLTLEKLGNVLDDGSTSQAGPVVAISAQSADKPIDFAVTIKP